MSVYIMLTTAHVDEITLARLKKDLRDYKTQAAVRTGIEFWITAEGLVEITEPVIGVLCCQRKDLPAICDIANSASIAFHLTESSGDDFPARYFVPLEYRRAVDLLEKVLVK